MILVLWKCKSALFKFGLFIVHLLGMHQYVAAYLSLMQELKCSRKKDMASCPDMIGMEQQYSALPNSPLPFFYF
jgi:hypothetical protein